MPPFRPITSAPSQAILRRVAERHGYVATRGPRAGQGNPAELVEALDAGELVTVLIDPDERRHLIAWLEQQATTMDDVLLAETVKNLARQLAPAE